MDAHWPTALPSNRTTPERINVQSESIVVANLDIVQRAEADVISARSEAFDAETAAQAIVRNAYEQISQTRTEAAESFLTAEHAFRNWHDVTRSEHMEMSQQLHYEKEMSEHFFRCYTYEAHFARATDAEYERIKAECMVYLNRHQNAAAGGKPL